STPSESSSPSSHPTGPTERRSRQLSETTPTSQPSSEPENGRFPGARPVGDRERRPGRRRARRPSPRQGVPPMASLLLNLPLWIGLSAAAIAATPPVPQAAPHHKLAVIRLTDATTVDAARLCGVALDCQARLPDDQAEIVVTADQEQRMLRLGARMTVAVQDLESYYAERLKGKRALPPAGIDWAGGSMGGYFTLAEMEALLDGFAAAYPAICTAKFSIGQSIEGRD